MTYMYILECCDGSYYTGSTWHLKQRINEHNSGLGARYTVKRLPVILVYYEEYNRIEDAFHREKQVQRWTKKKKTAMIKGDFDELPKLAKKIGRKEE
jgi:putative endonuclease